VGVDGMPNYWEYGEEVQSATHMFTGDGGKNGNAITSIDLTLIDVETAEWTDVELAAFPGEALRQVMVSYEFVIQTAASRTYVEPAITPIAQFIVRRLDEEWKIVQWYDRQQQYLQSGAERVSVGKGETSWGHVKNLYR
jgi:hypothetical protein